MVKAPLAAIFRRGIIGNVLNACWFQCAGFVTYYSINALFATHLQKDLGLSTALIATPIMLANVLVFLASSSWGIFSDRFGRRWAMIIPARHLDGDRADLPAVPGYAGDRRRLRRDRPVRRRRDVRADPGLSQRALSDRGARDGVSAFSYHVGAIAGGLVPPILTYFATNPSWNLGFAIPMLIGAMFGLVNFVVALLLGPETRGVEMVPDLVIA